MSLFFWFILLIISCHDLKENKIPNVMLVVLLIFKVISLSFQNGSFWYAILGGLLFFSGGFILYLLRALSPGDVKLLGVIGFYVEYGNLVEASLCITIYSGVVAVFYLMYNLSFLGVTNLSVIFMQPSLLKGSNTNYNKSQVGRYSGKLTMPFAPCVVLGMAAYSLLY